MYIHYCRGGPEIGVTVITFFRGAQELFKQELQIFYVERFWFLILLLTFGFIMVLRECSKYYFYFL